MKTNWMGLGLVVLLFGVPASTRAQVSIGAGIGIDIRFPTPPPLVVVSPGVQIVPEYDEEVYFVNNYYWVRRDAVWYRTRRCDAPQWRPVRAVYVPPTLVRIPPGRYRHYYRDDDGYWRAHDPDAYRSWRERHSWDERRAWWDAHHRDREVRMEQERSWREHQRREQAERREVRHQQEERRQQDRDRHDRDDRHDRGGGHGRH